MQAQTLDWAKSMSGTSNDQGINALFVADNAVYTTGFFRGALDLDTGPNAFNRFSNELHTFVQKLDLNGNLIWVKLLLGDRNIGVDIHTDAKGMVHIVGLFNGVVDVDPNGGVRNITAPNSTNNYSYTLRLDANASGWVRTINTPVANLGRCRVAGLDVDADGNVYTSRSERQRTGLWFFSTNS